MRALVLALSLWLGAMGALAEEADATFDDPVMNARYRALLHEVRCPKCLNESIADSKAPVAGDLRREVRRLLSEGATDQEVKDYLSARYGEFVLYRPRLSPTTWALWAGPFVFLVVGGVAFWRVLKVRRAQPLEEEAET